MPSHKVIKRASEFAQKLVAVWEKAGKPIMLYPQSPKIIPESWNGDRVFRDEIMESSLPEKQKKGLLDCLDMAIEEKEDLLTHYAKSTFIREIVKSYRKAIAELVGMDARNYRSTPICFITANALDVAKGNLEVKKALAKDRIPINSELKDALINKAVSLIKQESNSAKDIYTKALSLELLTGRRCYSELGLTANFHPYSENELIFTGQAKGSEEKAKREYIIPILGISPSEAVKALLEVREWIQSRPWYSENISKNDIKKKLETQIKQSLFSHYLPLFIPLAKAGHTIELTTHDLRKLYATICHQALAPQKSYTQYIATILGHDSIGKTGEIITKTQSSEHYDKFYLV
ncbi:hypothetical protein FEK30_01125 (plasmid) [Picosynechococcus sp. PCC 11901]|uniref:protelomerase family protein n=1 Tax=Picosynechococcus sp. PCC 11901 TaxID=2579791 RepID=UPI0010FC1DA2|nr:protelomerase family protein [Picosynechococcus sp. PCC 11901]QCS48146.1 hypothetical protein FEK30_01125 [Picosynechococcus sp. PCC 11901]